MAIPLVLVFATVLSIVGVFIIKTNKEHARQNVTSYNQLQAYFVARAGLEHALLKIKYLHRELYDAACLAQGRNPLYDFSREPQKISELTPGPVFLYYQSDANPVGFFTPNFDSKFPKARKWLDAFREDLYSGKTIDGEDLNFVLTMIDMPAKIKTLLHEPFTGYYEVTALDLVAQNVDETNNMYVNNQAIVEITVEAQINSARKESWVEKIKRTVRVSRDYKR